MRIGVLGGGIAGLACAHYLLKSGHTPIVFERSDQHGHLSQRLEHEGVGLDRFHETLHSSDTALLGLMADLRVLDRLVWREVNSGVVAGGIVGSEREIIRSTPLPLRDKIRGALAYLYVTHGRRYGAPLDQISAVAWLTRLCGPQVSEALVQPTLRARYGDYAEHIPAYSVWTEMNRRRWGDRAVRGYIRGGYQWLAEQLRDSIEQRGGEVLSETPVVGLEWEDAKVGVRCGVTESRMEFDAVISTLPPYELTKIARGEVVSTLPPEIPYQGVVSAAVVSRAPLDRFHETTLLDAELPFQTLYEATQVVPLEQTGGRHLLYLTKRCGAETEQYRLADDVIAKQALTLIEEVYPSYDLTQIEAVHVSRAPRIAPVWTVGSLKRRPPLRLGESRIYLCSSAQAYPRPKSWDTAVMQSRETTSKLSAECS